MGKVITVVAQKGGTGKTTAAFVIGHGLYKKGHKVVVVDSDDQSSVTDYSTQRMLTSVMTDTDSKDFFVSAKIVEESAYRQDIARARKQFDYVIIDTSGRFGSFHDDLIRESDHVIIPIEASRTDLVASLIVPDAVARQNKNRAEDEKIKFSYILQKGNEATNDFEYYNSLIEDRLFGLPYLPFSLSLRAMTSYGYTALDAVDKRVLIKEMVEIKRLEEIEQFESKIQTPELKRIAAEIKQIPIKPKAPTFSKKEIDKMAERIMLIVEKLEERVK